MFANQDIIRIAMRQSALDLNCKESDFLQAENVIVQANVSARPGNIIRSP